MEGPTSDVVSLSPDHACDGSRSLTCAAQAHSSWPHMIPASQHRAQCRHDSRITNIMKTLVIAAALLVTGAVAKPGGYTGGNISK